MSKLQIEKRGEPLTIVNGFAMMTRKRHPNKDIERAIVSAIRDFECAGVDGAVERVEPEDLASLSEIARRVGVTRAALQKYARGDSRVGRDFPAPVQNLSQPRRELFSTSEVMEWMLRKRRAEIPAVSVDLFRAIARTNTALDIRRARRDESIGRIEGLLSATGPEQPHVTR